MHVSLTSYIDVISSWCFWSEPTWAELKRRYEGRVRFEWKIALMDASGFPKTTEQAEWFYRRSGTMMQSKVMLKPGWYRPNLEECLPPNLLAVAARELGISGDRVRLALAEATLLEGRQTGDWKTAAEVAVRVSNLDEKQLVEKAKSPEIERQVRASTEEFHKLQVTQRPTFVLDTEIGDRAVFSGFVRLEPLVSALEAALSDAAGYASYAAHFGSPPA
jgi:predicted DsbA family dithiol-disulfide isomerase